jgi:hypothetical protein
MNCNEKSSNNCVDPILATCVDYEGKLGVNTKITKACTNQKDINEDLYAILDEEINSTNVKQLTSECMVIPAGSTVAEIIVLYENEICELKSKVSTLENKDYSQMDITSFNLVFPDCIADACETLPTTLSEWMQVIMEKINCA